LSTSICSRSSSSHNPNLLHLLSLIFGKEKLRPRVVTNASGLFLTQQGSVLRMPGSCSSSHGGCCSASSLRGRHLRGLCGRELGMRSAGWMGQASGGGIWAAAVWKVGASSGHSQPQPPSTAHHGLLPVSSPSLPAAHTPRPGQMVPIKPFPCGSSSLPTRLPSPSGHTAQLRVGELLSWTTPQTWT
jgi:hypothetical protein